MNLQLLTEKLPANLIEFAKTFEIPDNFLINDADLVILVLESKSLNTHEEKQNWFNLYPIMNEEQIARLREILTNEKQKLKEIEEKYQKKHEEIVQKYQQAYAANVQKTPEIKKAEAVAQQKESEDADSLLDLI